MELNEIVAELVKHDKAAVVTALQNGAHPVYQAVFDTGHSAATKAKKAELDAATQKVTDAENAKAEAERKLREAEGKAPDVDKIRAEYQEEIAKVKNAAKEREDALGATLRTEREKRALADLRGYLTSPEVGIDPDYAELLIERQSTRERLRFNDTGALEVLQAGKTIALDVAEGTNPLALFAKELREGAPAQWVRSGVDTGAGLTGGPTAPQGGKYDPVAAGKAMANSAKATTENNVAFR